MQLCRMVIEQIAFEVPRKGLQFNEPVVLLFEGLPEPGSPGGMQGDLRLLVEMQEEEGQNIPILPRDHKKAVLIFFVVSGVASGNGKIRDDNGMNEARWELLYLDPVTHVRAFKVMLLFIHINAEAAVLQKIGDDPLDRYLVPAD